MRFKDKTALITGSSRGIGRATAIAFAEEGANVVVNYVKNETAANEVVTEIKKLGVDAIAVQADVANEVDVQRMVEGVAKHFGGIDVLVNNAFNEKRVRDILDVEEEDWARDLNTILGSCWYCSKEVIPEMLKRGKGSIINISSIHGVLGLDKRDFLDIKPPKNTTG